MTLTTTLGDRLLVLFHQWVPARPTQGVSQSPMVAHSSGVPMAPCVRPATSRMESTSAELRSDHRAICRKLPFYASVSLLLPKAVHERACFCSPAAHARGPHLCDVVLAKSELLRASAVQLLVGIMKDYR